LPPSLSGTDSAGWAGPVLVLLGVADNSIIPLTGSMDVLTIWLAARHHEPWPYYAFMATLGAVIGGYITYALARKGGKETMERKLSKTTRGLKLRERSSAGDSLPSPFPPCCHRRSLRPIPESRRRPASILPKKFLGA